MDDPWANSDDEMDYEEDDVAEAGDTLHHESISHSLGPNATPVRAAYRPGSRANSMDSQADEDSAITIAALKDQVLVLKAKLDAAEADQRLPSTVSASVLASEIRVSPAAAQEALRRGLQLQRKQYLLMVEQLTANIDAKENAQRKKVESLQLQHKMTEENAQSLCIELGRMKEKYSELELAHKKLQQDFETSAQMHKVETQSLRQIVTTLQAELSAAGVTSDEASRSAQKAGSFDGNFPREKAAARKASRGPPPAAPETVKISKAKRSGSSATDKSVVKATESTASVGTASIDNIRQRVVQFYKQHNPSKLDGVDSILEKFAGRERELLVKLHEKYGITVPADIMFPDEADQFVVVVPRNHQKQNNQQAQQPAPRKTSALGKMFGATLGRVFRSSSSSNNDTVAAASDGKSSGSAVALKQSKDVTPPKGSRSRSRSRSGSDARNSGHNSNSSGSSSNSSNNSGAGGFFRFGRSNKLKEEHAATLQKMERDARERDEIHETERVTLKALVRQMSSEIEILKQKISDLQEQNSNDTDGAGTQASSEVETRWH